MNKSDFVIYCDDKGREHQALVFATNPFHPHHLSLVYVDEFQPEGSNVVKKFDLQHFSRINEPNPNLPTYHLNCWKEVDESHNAIPLDHPAYDHPHLPRPESNTPPSTPQKADYDGQVRQNHLFLNAAGQVRQNHLDHLKAVGEAQAAEAEAAKVVDPKEELIAGLQGNNADLAHEVDMLRAELAATTEGRDKALQSLADEHAKKQPSPADLDAVAAEQKAAEATSGADPAAFE